MINYDKWSYGDAKEYVLSTSLVALSNEAEKNLSFVDKILTLFQSRISPSYIYEQVPQSLVLRAYQISCSHKVYSDLEGYITDLSNDPLINNGTINIREKNKYGLSMLHVAVIVGNKAPTFSKIIRPLLQNGLDIDVKDFKGVTPLHYAVIMQKPELIQPLLVHGAKIDAVDEDGDTPLHVAASGGYTDCAKVLLKNRAPKTKNKQGQTLLHSAVMQGKECVLELLVKEEVNINSIDYSGLTPAHYAAHFGELQCLTSLCDLGAEIDVKDKSDKTPLHLAFENQHLKCALELLKRGASPFALDKNKRDPISYCKLDLKSEYRKSRSQPLYKGLSVQVAHPHSFFPEDLIKTLERLTITND